MDVVGCKETLGCNDTDGLLLGLADGSADTEGLADGVKLGSNDG